MRSRWWWLRAVYFASVVIFVGYVLIKLLLADDYGRLVTFAVAALVALAIGIWHRDKRRAHRNGEP
jgi:hypothetical protein